MIAALEAEYEDSRPLGRALQALNQQRFEPEGPGISARWGGVLDGDWDSAIHAIIEILLPPGLSRDDTGSTGLGALLERVQQVLVRGDVTADTLRINYLALLALCRAARAVDARPKLVEFAQDHFGRVFQRTPAALGFDALAATSSDPDHADELGAFLDELSFELEALLAPSGTDQTGDLRTLQAKLRVFLVLVACPAASRARLPVAVLTKFDELYALAAASDVLHEESGDFPPLGFFAQGAAVGSALYLVVSRALGTGPFDGGRPTALGEFAFDVLLPEPDAVKDLLESLGTVPQAKDLSAGLGLLLAPVSRLATEKAEAWQRYLLATRGPTGLNCYLPLTTGIAVIALQRYADAKAEDYEDYENDDGEDDENDENDENDDGEDDNDHELREEIDQSLAAIRRDRARVEGITHGLPFAQYAVYNELVLRSLLLVWQAGEPLQNQYRHWNYVVPAVRYILSCQATTGLFQERYGANEPDEGETAGSTLRTLARFSRTLQDPKFADVVGLDEKRRRDLQREIAWALERAVGGFLDVQNSSGGFATFARTEREKQGLLGTSEGPGAQRVSLYDTPAADSTSWVVDGLCALDSRAARERPVPGLRLRPGSLRDIDQAIERALGWLRRDFHPEAGWWARYGGGYVSGTSFALRALRAAGVPSNDPQVRRAAKLFARTRNRVTGGWGQTTDADDPAYNSDPQKVAMRGTADPELTGLAILGLLDAGVPKYDADVLGGVHYLLGDAAWKGGHWLPRGTPHSFMRFWNYQDQLHTDLRPVEALLRFSLRNPDPR
jgi:hypothetical protein